MAPGRSATARRGPTSRCPSRKGRSSGTGTVRSWPTWCSPATRCWPPGAAGAAGATPTSCRTSGGLREGGLGGHEPGLLKRLRLVVGTKADISGPDVEFDGMRISAVTHEGLGPFLGAVSRLVDEARATEGEVESFVVHRPAEEGFSVRRDEDGVFRVVGRLAERVVAMADLTNPDALAYVQDRFRRLGVDRALARAGARSGDTVRIAGIELEYSEPEISPQPS